MENKKVLLGMSGGVDSSVSALLLQKQGYEVIGATLELFTKNNNCDKNTYVDVKHICESLGISHYIYNCKQQFKEHVIQDFINCYSICKTPNPCIECNRYMKFGVMWEKAKELGCNYIATGHYAKITNHNGIYWLEKSADEVKDQSYFLSQLKYDYLQYIKFPLENIEKTEVRKIAEKIGLAVANKPESQDICFMKGKDYKSVIAQYYTNKKGDIIHINGTKLGEHNGIINYTQGQRKGLGIGYKEPLFVISLDPVNNLVYVGSEKDLYKDELKINNINFLDLSLKFNVEYEFFVKLRSTNSPSMAKVVFYDNNEAKVKLLEPSRNISKGQVCCFYDSNRVVASGYIL